MSLSTKVGGRESNSFITVAEADAFIANLPEDAQIWNELSPNEKEYRIEMSVQVMGFLSWRGIKIYVGQALPFPRSIQGRYGAKSIPDEVKRAQAQIAYSVVHRALLERPAIEEGTGNTKVSRVSLGGGLLSVAFTNDKGEKGSTFDTFMRSTHWPIYALLKPFLSMFRGRVVLNADEVVTLSTTTTSTSTTSTSTTSTTTTTTTT